MNIRITPQNSQIASMRYQGGQTATATTQPAPTPAPTASQTSPQQVKANAEGGDDKKAKGNPQEKDYAG